ncbi:MAG: uL30 family ribosomal protein [Nanoarchaeota archaeon]|nr:uL30 family ribosomal protein [Nanoarchaeota archaeon]
MTERKTKKTESSTKKTKIVETKEKTTKLAPNVKSTGKLLAVIRIAGEVKLNPDVRITLDRLRLRRKYACILMDSSNPSLTGMLKRVKFSVAYGEINKDTLAKLLKARGKPLVSQDFNPEKMSEEIFNGKNLEEIGFKPFFRLHPPRGGIKSKLQYPKGVLSDNKENINKLLIRML